MRYFWILLSVIILPLTMSAGLYGQSNHNLKGVVIDTLKNEAIEFATISLIPKGETSVLKYALTDVKGSFEISSVPEGVYNMRVEYIGYKPVIREITIARQRSVDLGKIGMIEDVTSFEAVTVTAMGNPITVKKDTIEFNAASFKTTENDMLEDLLKKLPGIEVDSEGNITANGKAIPKIMIDGKTFFLNDPQLATKNLPAKIVDKVRVVERRSEQAQFTGIDDGNDETVIDLSIRPGMMNGWFGNMTGGYGTDDRYQALGTAGRFSSSTQLMFIGNSNNTNNRAFTDMAGSMMRGMGGGGMGGGMGGGNIRVGGALMNLGGSGITTSWMLGANGSYETDNKKLRMGGSYSFGNSDNVSEGVGTRRTFLADSTFVYDQNTRNTSISDNHSASLEFDWKLSEKTSILFRPRISITKGESESTSAYNTIGFLGGADISGGDSRTYRTNDGQNLSGDLLFRQRLNKPGRTFSINLTYSYSNSEGYGHNESETYVNDLIAGTTDINTINQKYNTLDKSYSMGTRASYTEPLGGNFFLELAYRYNHSKSESTKEAFNFDGIGGWNIRDDDYSTDFTNTFITQQAEVNLRKNGEKLSYTVGMNAMPSRTKSIGGVQDIDRNVVNYSPIARIEYRFNETSNLRVNYRGNTRQPTINQLQPVPDNSNPLQIPIGNPDLLPSFTQSLSFDYRNTNRSTFRSLNASIGGNYTINSIVNKMWYEDGGVQYTQPINEDGGVYSLDGRLMYNTPIAKSKFFVMNNTSVDFNNGVSYSNALRNKTQTLSFSERLNVTYRGSKLEIGVGGRFRYNKSWYSINTTTKPSTWNNSAELSFNWTLPAGINLESNLNHTYYIGYGTGYNDPSTVWNASATKLLFKNMATLSLRVFDILKDARSVNMNQTDNYLQETRNTILGQYVMLSFTYRFGTFGGNRSRGGDQGGPRPEGGGPPMMIRR